MSETVKKFPPRPYNGKKSKYPIDKWFDGQIWKLEPDVDFACKPAGIRATLSTYAFRRGMGLKTRLVDECVYIQAVKRRE